MKQHDCIDTIGRADRVTAAPPALARLWLAWRAGCLGRLPDRLLMWLDRSRQRRRLGEMDDHMLRDIGVARIAAWAETQKWFWQP